MRGVLPNGHHDDRGGGAATLDELARVEGVRRWRETFGERCCRGWPRVRGCETTPMTISVRQLIDDDDGVTRIIARRVGRRDGRHGPAGGAGA